MKILLSHRFYWPETAPYGLMLRSIGTRLFAVGNDVHVFTSTGSYRNVSSSKIMSVDNNDIKVKRIWTCNEESKKSYIRIFNAFIYCWGLMVYIIRIRPDVVTASSFPPVLAAWIASLTSKIVGAKFIYHVMDIHPETSILNSVSARRRFIYFFARFLDNQTLKRSSAIIVLSNDMKKTLLERGKIDLPIKVINNFILGSEDVHIRQKKDKQRKRLIYAGTMGRFQNLDLLISRLFPILKNRPDIELILMGDGPTLPDLKRKWGGQSNITFIPFLPISEAKPIIETADIGLVALNEGMYKLAYPSKLLTYWGLGIPVLTMIENESEIVKTINKNNLGLVLNKSFNSQMEASFLYLLDKKTPDSEILDWYERTFSLKQNTLKWLDVLEQVEAS